MDRGRRGLAWNLASTSTGGGGSTAATAVRDPRRRRRARVGADQLRAEPPREVDPVQAPDQSRELDPAQRHGDPQRPPLAACHLTWCRKVDEAPREVETSRSTNLIVTEGYGRVHISSRTAWFHVSACNEPRNAAPHLGRTASLDLRSGYTVCRALDVLVCGEELDVLVDGPDHARDHDVATTSSYVATSAARPRQCIGPRRRAPGRDA